MKPSWPVDDDRIARGLYWGHSWKLVEGCSPVSAGCGNCWSATETRVRESHPNVKISAPKQGLVEGGHFNGKIRLREDNLDLPLRRKKPTVYSIWNDLFHEDVPVEFIDEVFTIIALSPQHIFLLLTKRPKKMLAYFENMREGGFSEGHIRLLFERPGRAFPKIKSLPWNNYEPFQWPLPNVILGTSVEDQKTADETLHAAVDDAIQQAKLLTDDELKYCLKREHRVKVVRMLMSEGRKRARAKS